MNYGLVHSSQKITKKYPIPPNTHEIMRSSLPKDLDVTNLVKTEITRKIINDEMNDFNFYDIPFAERIDTDKLNRTGFADFKSINKLQAFNEKRGIRTTGRFFQRKFLSEYEKNIRKQLRSDDNKIFLLREMYLILMKTLSLFRYENFDKAERDPIQKTEPASLRKYQKKIETENFEKQTIQDLDNWDVARKEPIKRNPNKKKEEKKLKKKKSKLVYYLKVLHLMRVFIRKSAFVGEL